MRTILHIFWKDLRCGWTYLVLWVGALGVFGHGVLTDPLDIEAMQSGGFGMLMFLAVGAVIGTATVIQEDGLADPRGFWMTRPIGPLSLLASKAVFVAVFFVLPFALIHVAALAKFGHPAERLGAVFLDSALPWAAMLAVAALLAAMTRGLPTFSAALLGLVTASSLFPWVEGVASSLGAAAATLLVAQYLTRRRAVIALAGVAASIVAGYNPLDYRFDQAGQQTGPDLGLLEAELTPGPGRAHFAVARPELPGSRRATQVRAVPRFRDAPQDWVLWGGIDGGIEWLDGAGSTECALRGSWFGSDDAPPIAGLDWAAGLQSTPQREIELLSADPPAAFLGRRGRLSASRRMLVFRAVEHALALKTGAEFRYPKIALRLLDVRIDSSEIEILARLRGIASERVSASPSPYLVNRSRREAIPLAIQHTNRAGAAVSLVLFSRAVGAREEIWSADLAGIGLSHSEWLAGAEVALLAYEPVGEAELSVTANLTLDTQLSEPSPDNNDAGNLGVTIRER